MCARVALSKARVVSVLAPRRGAYRQLAQPRALCRQRRVRRARELEVLAEHHPAVAADRVGKPGVVIGAERREQVGRRPLGIARTSDSIVRRSRFVSGLIEDHVEADGSSHRPVCRAGPRAFDRGHGQRPIVSRLASSMATITTSFPAGWGRAGRGESRALSGSSSSSGAGPSRRSAAIAGRDHEAQPDDAEASHQ